MFVRKHKITTHKLSKPIKIRTADGELSKHTVTHFCHLAIKIDDRVMIGKFNVLNMSDKDMILLGKPWLNAMNPDIDWTNDTLRLPSTPRSIRLENIYRKKWGLHMVYTDGKPHGTSAKPTVSEELETDGDYPRQKPLPKDGKRTIE